MVLCIVFLCLWNFNQKFTTQ